MKSVGVGALLLGFLSICGADPLPCERLKGEVNEAQDVSGSWYGIAFSSDSCVMTSLMIYLYRMSLIQHIRGTPKSYELFTQSKMISFCDPKNTTYTYGYTFYLLPSCPECIVLKEDWVLFGPSYYLLSPRPTVDAAALGQFETMMQCFGLYGTHRLNTDFAFSFCKYDTKEEWSAKEKVIMAGRVEESMPQLGKCLARILWREFKAQTLAKLGIVEKESNA